jgi:hypothetical protein
MPVSFVNSEESPLLLLEGIIAAEDTDEVVSHLKGTPAIGVDLSKCEHLHTAVLQAIIILKPRIVAMPADPFWSRCISYQMEEINYEDNSAGG